MTPKEICEKIVAQGDCLGFSCDLCPFVSGNGCIAQIVAAKKWLADHKDEEMTEERIRQIVREELNRLEMDKDVQEETYSQFTNQSDKSEYYTPELGDGV